MTIWRIEDFEKVAFDEDLYGQFWGGDSYIVLYTYRNAQDQEEHAIYFWLGDTSSQDERGERRRGCYEKLSVLDVMFNSGTCFRCLCY